MVYSSVELMAAVMVVRWVEWSVELLVGMLAVVKVLWWVE